MQCNLFFFFSWDQSEQNHTSILPSYHQTMHYFVQEDKVWILQAVFETLLFTIVRSFLSQWHLDIVFRTSIFYTQTFSTLYSTNLHCLSSEIIHYLNMDRMSLSFYPVKHWRANAQTSPQMHISFLNHEGYKMGSQKHNKVNSFCKYMRYYMCIVILMIKYNIRSFTNNYIGLIVAYVQSRLTFWP